MSELSDVAELISAVHLKSWDDEKADSRISSPLRGLDRLLPDSDFTGTRCLERDGQASLDDDPGELTRARSALACDALKEGDTP